MTSHSSDNPPDQNASGRKRRRDVADNTPNYDGYKLGTAAFVIGAYIDPRKGEIFGSELAPRREPEARLEEALQLARAISLDIKGSCLVRLRDPKPATLISGARIEELAPQLKANGVSVVIIDAALTPIQQRNLEKAWELKVIDRTGLILEIFGRRARTKEGVLQVELAHLSYQKSRLVRSWTHLERQRGGHGFLGGPGERQIELDRRRIQERIEKLERDLEAVRRTRALHRKARQRVPYPLVALVGYTNAGKSTLFNRLTAADVLAADMLFATLDPTLRATRLPHGQPFILSDTVGFVSDLPTQLVAAFRSTLEEVIQADLILHVRDASHPDWEAQAQDVNKTLEALGMDIHDSSRIRQVWNKLDALSETQRAVREQQMQQFEPDTVLMISSQTAEGLPALLSMIEECLHRASIIQAIHLPCADGEGLAWLHRHCDVLEVKTADDMLHVQVSVPHNRLDYVQKRYLI